MATLASPLYKRDHNLPVAESSTEVKATLYASADRAGGVQMDPAARADMLALLPVDAQRRLLFFLDAESLAVLLLVAKARSHAALPAPPFASPSSVLSGNGSRSSAGRLMSSESDIGANLDFDVSQASTSETSSQSSQLGRADTNVKHLLAITAGGASHSATGPASGITGKPSGHTLLPGSGAARAVRRSHLQVPAGVGHIFALILPHAKAICVDLLRLTGHRNRATSSTAAQYAWPPGTPAVTADNRPVPSHVEDTLSVVHGPVAAQYDPYPKITLDSLHYRRQRPRSWLEVLDDLEGWARMRRDSAMVLHPGGPMDPALETDATLYENMSKLLEKEAIQVKVFPYRSLCHAFQSYDDFDIRMGWRRRLVEWIRNLNVHFQLLPPVLADAVALADRYIYSHGTSLSRTLMQLLFITSLSIAARVHKVKAETITEIRAIAPDYTAQDYATMEARMVHTMGTTAERSSSATSASRAASAASGAVTAVSDQVRTGGGGGGGAGSANATIGSDRETPVLPNRSSSSAGGPPSTSAVTGMLQRSSSTENAGPPASATTLTASANNVNGHGPSTGTGSSAAAPPMTVVPVPSGGSGQEQHDYPVRPVLVPSGPPGIMTRYSPTGAPSNLPDVQMVVMATPFAFAGHIICFLTRAWGERIAPTVREALYIAMKEWEAQRFTPATIAVASVFLGLRTQMLWDSQACTAWLTLVYRTLHIDMYSVRDCAQLLTDRAGPTSQLNLPLPAPVPAVQTARPSTAGTTGTSTAQGTASVGPAADSSATAATGGADAAHGTAGAGVGAAGSTAAAGAQDSSDGSSRRVEPSSGNGGVAATGTGTSPEEQAAAASKEPGPAPAPAAAAAPPAGGAAQPQTHVVAHMPSNSMLNARPRTNALARAAAAALAASAAASREAAATARAARKAARAAAVASALAAAPAVASQQIASPAPAAAGAGAGANRTVGQHPGKLGSGEAGDQTRPKRRAKRAAPLGGPVEEGGGAEEEDGEDEEGGDCSGDDGTGTDVSCSDDDEEGSFRYEGSEGPAGAAGEMNEDLVDSASAIQARRVHRTAQRRARHKTEREEREREREKERERAMVAAMEGEIRAQMERRTAPVQRDTGSLERRKAATTEEIKTEKQRADAAEAEIGVLEAKINALRVAGSESDRTTNDVAPQPQSQQPNGQRQDGHRTGASVPPQPQPQPQTPPSAIPQASPQNGSGPAPIAPILRSNSGSLSASPSGPAVPALLHVPQPAHHKQLSLDGDNDLHSSHQGPPQPQDLNQSAGAVTGSSAVPVTVGASPLPPPVSAAAAPSTGNGSQDRTPPSGHHTTSGSGSMTTARPPLSDSQPGGSGQEGGTAPPPATNSGGGSGAGSALDGGHAQPSYAGAASMLPGPVAGTASGGNAVGSSITATPPPQQPAGSGTVAHDLTPAAPPLHQPQPLQQPQVHLAARLAAMLESGISSFSATPQPSRGSSLGLSASTDSSNTLGGESDKAVAGTPGDGATTKPRQSLVPAARHALGAGAAVPDRAAVAAGSSAVSPHGKSNAHMRGHLVDLGHAGSTVEPDGAEAVPQAGPTTTSARPAVEGVVSPPPAQPADVAAAAPVTEAPPPSMTTSRASTTPPPSNRSHGAGAVAALAASVSPVLIPAPTAPGPGAAAGAGGHAFMTRGSSFSTDELDTGRSPVPSSGAGYQSVPLAPLLAGQASFSASAAGAASSSREDPTTARSDGGGFSAQQAAAAAAPRTIAHSLGASGVYPQQTTGGGSNGVPAAAGTQQVPRLSSRRLTSASSNEMTPSAGVGRSPVGPTGQPAPTSTGAAGGGGFLPAINLTPRNSGGGGGAGTPSGGVPSLSARRYSSISLGTGGNGTPGASGSPMMQPLPPAGSSSGSALTPRRTGIHTGANNVSPQQQQQQQAQQQQARPQSSPSTVVRLPPLGSMPTSGSSSGNGNGYHGFLPNSARDRLMGGERERLATLTSDGSDSDSDPAPGSGASPSASGASGSGKGILGPGAAAHSAASPVADVGLPAPIGGGAASVSGTGSGSERRRHSLPHPHHFRTNPSPATGRLGRRKGSSGASGMLASQQGSHFGAHMAGALLPAPLSTGYNHSGTADGSPAGIIAAGAGALLSPARTPPGGRNAHTSRSGNGATGGSGAGAAAGGHVHSTSHASQAQQYTGSASVSVSGSPYGRAGGGATTPHYLAMAAGVSSASPDVIMLLQLRDGTREQPAAASTSNAGHAAQQNLRLQRSGGSGGGQSEEGAGSGAVGGAGAVAGHPIFSLSRGGAAALVPLPGVMEQPEREREADPPGSIEMATSSRQQHAHSSDSDEGLGAQASAGNTRPSGIANGSPRPDKMPSSNETYGEQTGLHSTTETAHAADNKATDGSSTHPAVGIASSSGYASETRDVHGSRSPPPGKRSGSPSKLAHQHGIPASPTARGGTGTHAGVSTGATPTQAVLRRPIAGRRT